MQQFYNFVKKKHNKEFCLNSSTCEVSNFLVSLSEVWFDEEKSLSEVR